MSAHEQNQEQEKDSQTAKWIAKWKRRIRRIGIPGLHGTNVDPRKPASQPKKG